MIEKIFCNYLNNDLIIFNIYFKCFIIYDYNKMIIIIKKFTNLIFFLF